MSKRLDDGLPDSLSKQRRWQLRQTRRGNCRICGRRREHSTLYCDIHLQAVRVSRGNKPRQKGGVGRPLGVPQKHCGSAAHLSPRLPIRGKNEAPHRRKDLLVKEPYTVRLKQSSLPGSAVLLRRRKAKKIRQPRQTCTELQGNGSAPVFMALPSTQESLSRQGG